MCCSGKRVVQLEVEVELGNVVHLASDDVEPDGAILALGADTDGAGVELRGDHDRVLEGTLALLHLDGLTVEVLAALGEGLELLTLTAGSLLGIISDVAGLATRALGERGLLVASKGADLHAGAHAHGVGACQAEHFVKSWEDIHLKNGRRLYFQ